jgi:CubicO group peptidase (beta-lactamase class C family)
MLQACTLKESRDVSRTKSSDKDNILHNELSEYLEQISALDMFSGVVLISKGNEIVFEKAYGMADKSQIRLNNIDTILNVGSMAKMFTSGAVAALVEQGKLSFNDTIEKYVNGFPYEAASKITVADLLTHTARLGPCRIYMNGI